MRLSSDINILTRRLRSSQLAGAGETEVGDGAAQGPPQPQPGGRGGLVRGRAEGQRGQCRGGDREPSEDEESAGGPAADPGDRPGDVHPVPAGGDQCQAAPGPGLWLREAQRGRGQQAGEEGEGQTEAGGPPGDHHYHEEVSKGLDVSR